MDQNVSRSLAAFSAQPVARQMALLLGIAASIALGVGMVQWANTPDYKPLFAPLGAEDTNRAIAALETGGIAYRLNAGTGMLAIPAGQVQQARLLLASEGLPGDGGSGFKNLYQEQEIGLSSFMERARFNRALESELAQTISALEGVRSARVHLAVARPSAFLRKRDMPAASVVLHLYDGQVLSPRQLAGVVNLVSSSVPDLSSDRVAVVDQRGQLLSGQDKQNELGYTQEQFRYAELLEQRFGNRITDILEPFLGVGAVRAQVTADIDFTRVERTSEQFSPETVIRSEQTTESLSSAGNGRLGGVPGTLSNQPPTQTEVTEVEVADAAGTGDAGLGQPLDSNRSQVRNYEVDKTISHIRETPGTIRKLSVALVVDYVDQAAEDGTVERVPLSAERIDEITRLARDAIGFNAGRGDTVSVINASFVPLPEPEAVEGPSILEQDWVWVLARWLAVVLGSLLLVLFVLRPLIRFSTTAPPALPGKAAGGGKALPAGRAGGGTGELEDDQVTLGGERLSIGHEGYRTSFEEARIVVDEEPRRAAHVMKQWIAENG
ncbi:MAG: flagellar basal-body MS-ring/collar protein FliF [Parahaliea sp.]